jgi:hypothetical protein
MASKIDLWREIWLQNINFAFFSFYFQIQMNSYAYDFWKNGSKDDLIKINKLSQLEYWYLIDNFSVSFGSNLLFWSIFISKQ